MKKTIGYTLFVFSFIPFALIPILPFLDISKGQIAAVTTSSLVAGEAAFFASVALLGKETLNRIKAAVSSKIAKRK